MVKFRTEYWHKNIARPSLDPVFSGPVPSKEKMTKIENYNGLAEKHPCPLNVFWRKLRRA